MAPPPVLEVETCTHSHNVHSQYYVDLVILRPLAEAELDDHALPDGWKLLAEGELDDHALPGEWKLWMESNVLDDNIVPGGWKKMVMMLLTLVADHACPQLLRFLECTRWGCDCGVEHTVTSGGIHDPEDCL